MTRFRAARDVEVAPPTGYWGRRLPDLPTDFIFGYGSLINGHLRDQTSMKPIAGSPVRLSAAFGHLRAWIFRCPTGFTALGLRPPRRGEAPMTVNGVIYPVAHNDLAAFDLREAGYRRIPVPPGQIEAVSWQPLPVSGTIWVYVPIDDAEFSQVGPASGDFPILQSYIDAVVEGALDYGDDYARELIETTADWNRFWLNDRAMARRPWIYDRHYAETDQLLSTIAPASAHFQDRLFPGPFAARWLYRPVRLREARPRRAAAIAPPLIRSPFAENSE
ncbi:gamma-glutamylcyclotransferase family protein [Methylobacterium sp. Leaf118]|uniref:gamma-glutamylcyclotransferase family protein n=1 Tax=Methylobacterium sp. Leaf118 TaxID=2876562 RepID=UPI001E3F5B87|nr:gamma-glutamylcyclotransferase family protein [Methylobacterium sp. Leaf118]